MTRVRASAEALHQLSETDAWWREHRQDAPDRVLEEYLAAVDRLEDQPHSGTRFPHARRPNVRRLLLRKTQNHIYYVFASDEDVVDIIAVWGGPKGRGPGI